MQENFMAETIKDWTKYIIPKVYENQNGEVADFVYINSVEDVKNLTDEQRMKKLTDYCDGFRNSYLLREKNSWTIVNPKGEIVKNYYDDVLSVCPLLSLKLPKDITFENLEKHAQINEVKDAEEKVLYHTIELGEYPQTEASKERSEELTKMFNKGNLQNKMKCTGKLFCSIQRDLITQERLSKKQDPEFEFEGERYVASGPTASKWCKVEPLVFKITNYEQFKAGKTQILELESEKVVFGQKARGDDLNQPWEKSLFRAFLNDLKMVDENGNVKWDFSQNGFFHQVFGPEKTPTKEYVVPKCETKICDRAFAKCVGLEKIVIPKHVEGIGIGAFEECVNAQVVVESLEKNVLGFCLAFLGANFKYVYFSKNDGSLILSPRQDKSLEKDFFCKKIDYPLESPLKDSFLNKNYAENFVNLSKWKEQGKTNFVPPFVIVNNFPSSEMEKFFANGNAKRWGKLVQTFGFDKMEGQEKENSITDLFKIYYAIGGFSGVQKESEQAWKYLVDLMIPSKENSLSSSEIGQIIHSRFSKLEITGAFNPTFAKFFQKYYKDNPNFVLPNDEDPNANVSEFWCRAHNGFDTITKNFPNRIVGHGMNNEVLSLEFVAKHLDVVSYEGTKKENEDLAKLVGKYGYSQEQFDQIQQIFDTAKTQKDAGLLDAEKPCGKNMITFRMLKKDDPLGFVLGDITNCCQHIGGNGASCVVDGYTNPNAGFLVFEAPRFDLSGNQTQNKRIVGQAYVWFDEKTKTVCLDNIEIPRNIAKELSDKNSKLLVEDFLNAVEESANAILSKMTKNGINVQNVTMGESYNDLCSVGGQMVKTKFGEPIKNPKAKNKMGVYSDASTGQYLIGTYAQFLEKNGKEVSKEALNTFSAN